MQEHTLGGDKMERKSIESRSIKIFIHRSIPGDKYGNRLLITTLNNIVRAVSI